MTRRAFRPLDDIFEEILEDLVGSHPVGHHKKDKGLRTDGRPKDGEHTEKRTERLFTMLARTDRERFRKWAADRGLTMSTANALILRERLDKDGY